MLDLYIIHLRALFFTLHQVEDGEYFQTLPENTIFILLRPGEAWAPAGEDIVSQGDSTFPTFHFPTSSSPTHSSLFLPFTLTHQLYVQLCRQYQR